MIQSRRNILWNLNGSFRGPISSLDVSSLLKSDHIASISNDHLTLSKARQDVLKDVKENIRTLLYKTFLAVVAGIAVSLPWFGPIHFSWASVVNCPDEDAL